MFYYDFPKGQVSERLSTVSSFTIKTNIRTDTHFLTGPRFSCHARSFHHIVTQTWVPEDGPTHVSFHHHSSCHHASYLDNMSQGSHNLTLIVYREYQVWQKTTWFTPVTSLWRLLKLDAEAERGGSCRGEVKWEHWVRNPLALKLWRGCWRRASGGPEYLLAVWRNRQSRSSPVSMATIRGPTQVLVEVFCFSRGSD